MICLLFIYIIVCLIYTPHSSYKFWCTKAQIRSSPACSANFLHTNSPNSSVYVADSRKDLPPHLRRSNRDEAVVGCVMSVVSVRMQLRFLHIHNFDMVHSNPAIFINVFVDHLNSSSFRCFFQFLPLLSWHVVFKG